MPKKNFIYKSFNDSNEIWYTDSLKGWFIVKEQDKYILRKGKASGNIIELSTVRFNTYKNLGDAKTGLERKLKERTQCVLNQQILFDKLKQEYGKPEKYTPVSLDYNELNKQAEQLKQKWGIK